MHDLTPKKPAKCRSYGRDRIVTDDTLVHVISSYAEASNVAGSLWDIHAFNSDVLMERRIVILGRTGAGKSSSGNNILQKDAFESSACGTSVTRKCQRGTTIRSGINIQLIDTPGLFDTEMSEEAITREIVKCIGMTAPGPHAFVLVIRIDRFTKEEQDTVEHFKKVFGEAMLKYLMILFTRKDDLIHDGQTIEEYLQKAPAPLKSLLASCDNRYVAFNNHGSECERSQDVQSFLSQIEATVNDNGGTYYTNDMFKDAERAMREREEQLLQENQETSDQLRREVEDEYRKEMKKLDETQREITGPIQDEISRLETVSKNRTSSTQIQQLQSELKEMRTLLEETKREAAEARARADREAEQRKAQCAATPANCREQARQEVNTGQDIVMGLLGFLAGDVMQRIITTVGEAVAKGLSDLIGTGFEKAKEKINCTKGTK